MQAASSAPLPQVSTAKQIKDWQWLLLLAVLIVPVRVWLVVNTEVMARDSIGFIRYALLFDERSWGDVVRSIDQHPGYPMAVWLTSIPLRALSGQTTPHVMQLSSQLVSAVAAVVLIVPGYYLGKALGGARVGFGGCLFFQLLPVSGQHLSDGVSESLYLLLLATALWGAVRGAQSQRWTWFVVCGVASGLAYLTRPEGLLVPAAAAGVLAFVQFIPGRRQRWSQVAGQGIALAIPILVLGALYVMPTGRLTRKPALQQALNVHAADVTPMSTGRPSRGGELWADFFVHVRAPSLRLARGCRAVVVELVNALYYIGVLPVAAAVWWRGRRLWFGRGTATAALFFLGHMAALLWLATRAGYLSDRHLLPLVLLLSYVMMIGLVALGERWAARGRAAFVGRVALGPNAVAFGLVALLIAGALPQTLKKLHGNRAGNHAAGLWLAQRWQPGDVVLDDHCWSHYYANQVFLENKEAPAEAGKQATCYVVITRSTDPKVRGIREEREQDLRKSRGEIVFHWPPVEHTDRARVVVYALPRAQGLGAEVQ